MMDRVTKAVFPVAGMGTRFLPATKASPKEMLPVVDKPLIQYAVDEAVSAGIKDLIFVTGRNKRAIEDHFDKAYELENELERQGKEDLLALVRHIVPPDVNCIFIRQSQVLGLGHAVLCAHPVIGNEPFAVLLADDLIDNHGNLSALGQMIDVYQQCHCPVLATMMVAPEETGKYGIVVSEPVTERLSRVTAIVEKPRPEEAPSTQAVVGRYILPGEIFGYLRQLRPGSGGELQLTDAIAQLLSDADVMALRYQGTRYDCGSKLGYLKATVELGCRHPEVGEDFRAYLQMLK